MAGPTRPRRGRRAVLRAAAVLLACVAAAVLVELGLRLFVAEEDLFVGDGFYLADPRLGPKLRPGYARGNIRINSLGMRGPEATAKKPPGTRRILLLGDSFAFGVLEDPSQIFARLLEAGLRERLGAVEVLNAGVPSWGTVQELRYLERDGLGLEPDLIVVALYMGNDVTDNVDVPQYTSINGYLVPRWVVASIGSWRMRLAITMQHSRLYRFVRHRLASRGGSAHGVEKLLRDAVLKQDPQLLRLRLDQHRKELRPDDAAFLEEGWSATLGALGRMQELARGRGAGFCVVLIPDDLQLNPHWRRALENEGTDPEAFDFTRADRRLSDFCKARAIPMLDLSFALAKKYQKDVRPYGPAGTKMDGHFNELGDATAARRILSFILEERLLPGAGGGGP